MSESNHNSALSVLYEPIELQSHFNYKKKSFIDRLRISNPNQKDENNDTLFTIGMLIIDLSNKRLLFRPNDFSPSKDLIYYQDNFYKKMTIPFNNIKSLYFVNKNNEYVSFKSSSSIVKSYQSFIIYCYDFRVYNFNRVGVHNKIDAVKFYQNIYRLVFERDESVKNVDRKNLSPDLITSVYHKTVNNINHVESRIFNENIVILPSNIDKIKSKINFEYGPQIVYHSDHNGSCLLIIDKSDSKKDSAVWSKFSDAILGSKSLQPTLFYLNEISESKSEYLYPTTKELIESFDKLYTLCTPRNNADFKRSDKKWLSKLADCGWLNLVNRCLLLTKHIFDSLANYHSSSYLIEQGCPVWGWLFGSLIQVICQPYVRTISGFLSMIDKNWILSGAYNNPECPKPTLFLLFLDCVYQLLRSSPFLFEFNEEMLIFLYDLFALAPSGFMNSADYEFNRVKFEDYFVDQVLDCLENKFFEEMDFIGFPKIDLFDFDSFWFKMYARWIPYIQVECGSMSLRHHYMVRSLNLENVVYSNYPFSLNYDKITMNVDFNNNDDTRSINTLASDD